MTSEEPSRFAIAIGTMWNDHGAGALRIEMRLEASVDDVWSALTKIEHLSQWYGEIDGDLFLGGEYRARLFASGWEGSGKIEICDAPRQLVVTATMKGSDITDRTDVTLEPDGDGTMIVVEQIGVPLDFVSAYAAGMQIHVEDLSDHLAGEERREAELRFDALEPVYKTLPVLEDS